MFKSEMTKPLRCFNNVLLSNLSCSSLHHCRLLSSYVSRHVNVYNVNKSNETQPNSLFTHKLLGCHNMCARLNQFSVTVPSGARGIIIGKLYNRVSELSFQNLLQSLNESVPVIGARDMFLWTDSFLGLPWWVNIVVTTVLARAVLYMPAAAYLERWSANREKYTLDGIPISARLRAAEGNRKQVRELIRARKQLVTEHNCQTYKFVLTLSWQVSNMLVLSAGLRQCLLTLGGSGLREATLPWGSELGYPDPFFILPVVNLLLNIIMIEMDAWKMHKKNEELLLSLKRGSFRSREQQVMRSQRFQLIVRRISCIFLLAIYVTVPSSLTLLWCVMLLHTLGFRFALLHPKVRRLLGIPHRCYETTQPHRDFLLYLGTYLQSMSSMKK